MADPVSPLLGNGQIRLLSPTRIIGGGRRPEMVDVAGRIHQRGRIHHPPPPNLSSLEVGNGANLMTGGQRSGLGRYLDVTA